ncbi:hypothetical protein KR093_007879 [Drosophila rubida]|uniref:Uncharacterized protein n=1 Tax=Drosophila rubida TaxID=30044 RepID=A0AAD4K876_9MUSC|nr:hypothetical protein KR093_007879 [Drosophila rubida]
MSRSLLAKHSTKQRKSTKVATVEGTTLSKSRMLLQRGTKLPEFKCLLAPKTPSAQCISLADSHKVPSTTEVRSLNCKRRYSAPKVAALRKPSEGSTSIAVLEKSTRLSDLTKYWTKPHTLQQKTEKSGGYSPHNLKG